MGLFLIILLILLNGLLSMSEMSVVSAKRSKLDIEAKKGKLSAKRAIELSNNPDNFLSTVQVGITLIGILTGMVSGEAFSGDLAVVFDKVEFLKPYSLAISEIVIVIAVTYLTLIFGELVPKRIGMLMAERISKLVASPMIMLSKIVSPAVWLLSKSTNGVIKLLGLHSMEDSKVTEEEIKAMVQESLEDGEIEEVEHDIVERVFNLGDRAVSSLMTHRTEVVVMDINTPTDEVKKLIKERPYGSYPVVDGSIDKVVGVVMLKKIVSFIDEENFSLEKILSVPAYILNKSTVYKALELLKKAKMQTGIVIDEYGGLVGIVTLKDILEGLVGELPQTDETEEWIKREDGSVLVDGQYPFFDFLERYEIEDKWKDNDFDTLAGLIINELNEIPTEGQIIEWDNFKFEIVDMDGAKIDKILVHVR